MIPELSIVVPLHDEARALPVLIDALVEVLEPLGLSFEIVLVDDGSSDDTAAVMADRAQADPRIVDLYLARNFGKEAALAAGLTAAQGRGVVLMDGDLKHPPEVIPKLAERWHQGAEVVNAVETPQEDEGWAFRTAASVFHRLMGHGFDRSRARPTDFKLLDRTVVDILERLPERNRFFRGLVAWVGFHTAEVPFVVADRFSGTTSRSVWGLVRNSVRNLVAFTSLPLRLVASAAFAVCGFAVLLALQTFAVWAMGYGVDGFATTILAVLIVGGMNLLGLAVVCLYLAGIYEEVKGRPVFVVRPKPQESAPAEASDATVA